jgi:predicted O-methyltransferase YrrM
VDVQLDFLNRFDFNQELLRFPLKEAEGKKAYYYHNIFYGSGDAEYLYSMIRLLKPSRLIEVGSGLSTLIAREAIQMNSRLDSTYRCEHVCIEPYENTWLKEAGVTLVRSAVELVDKRLFAELGVNDILFIDSSHIIRPQGDVLYLYQEILPIVRSGVFVHVHDIFTPKDYLDAWIVEKGLLWNEQYLLEAFLTFNKRFEIVGACNYLSHHHTEQFTAKCPVYAKEAGEREPGAFWIRAT